MRVRLLIIALSLIVSAFVAPTLVSTIDAVSDAPGIVSVGDAAAHQYYTCDGYVSRIGGGGYGIISVWRDTVGGWSHYRANTFYVHPNQYFGYWGCG